VTCSPRASKYRDPILYEEEERGKNHPNLDAEKGGGRGFVFHKNFGKEEFCARPKKEKKREKRAFMLGG